MISWRLAGLIVLAILLLATSSVMSTAAMVVCLGVAFFGPMRALQALMSATLIVYSNTAIVKYGAANGILLRLVLIAVVVRMAPTLRASDLRLLWPIWLFALIVSLTSVATSPALSISIMKAVTLALAATAVLMAYQRLSPTQLKELQSWFLTLGVTVLSLSALTMLKPGLGAGGNGGLQGVLNQPQALGIFIAPFAAWSIAGVLLMRNRASRLEVWLAIGTLVLIVLSRARTAGFATAFGVLVVMFARMLSQRRARQASVIRPVLIVTLAAVAVIVAAATTGKVSKILTDYAFKGTERETRNLGEAFYASRGGGVAEQWHNFLQQPLLGNGFGVYPDGKFPSGVAEIWGIPISAPIEKGFLPTAILEEGGMLGGAALALLILWLSLRAWRNSDLRWRAMYVACLGVNIGECVFLSPGGIGMFDWLLLGLALNAYRTETLQANPRRRVGVAKAAVSKPAESAMTTSYL